MKYVLVTGAYGGMGSATVSLLRQQGYGVFALDKTVCSSEDDGVIPLQADITDEASVQNAFEQVSAVTDELFAVMHFAGIYSMDSLVEMSVDHFDTIFNVNVRGAYLVNKTFLPMLKSGSRVVITTSELAPLDPLPFTGIYAVTKAALDKYAYSLRMELQLLGVSVSVIRAGAVSTNMLGASTDALDRFCNKTQLYSCNAERFKKIVNSVEARSIPASKLARKAVKVMNAKHPKFVYNINRNFLLLLLNALPKGMQCSIIKKVLK